LSFCTRSVVLSSRSLSIIHYSITSNGWRIAKNELERRNAQIITDIGCSLRIVWRRDC
jgi:hypothetical protein